MGWEEVILYTNSWTARKSDPGEEGSTNHLFETTHVALTATLQDGSIHYQFLRKIEDKILSKHEFHELNLLFKFMDEYLDSVGLGLLGVKIGHLEVSLVR